MHSPVWPGQPRPLGASWDGQGVNFALYSQHAERVELCLFDAEGRRELGRVALRERTGFVWHCYLPQARPGLAYGYRVHGPHAPERGHRYDPQRLLLDPYARLMSGELASGMGRCQVLDPAFDWDGDRAPRIPLQDSVIYELHVRGFSKRHPGIPEPLRGTYAGLACAPAIEHFKRLGITALELLPVHALVDERRLAQHGLRNYWGYNSIGYFAPEMRYAASGTPGEFKAMVKTLHAAGIEVILDVVYNHTGEGDHLGPTLCFRGIDNAVYYRLDPRDRRHYVNYTGTGNSLDASHPVVLALIMDSLRYWIQEMHVDGFRFDLATTLARGARAYDGAAAFFSIIGQDPVISQVKLIAEPWDLGEGGYQAGNFPPGWSEWNDKYRDAVRAYWKGDGGLIGELAARLTGSRDLFERSGRGPSASINYVTAHDGFTLHDLVSYERKRNAANYEDNRDGADDNRSWNCGVEGPSDEPRIVALRNRQKRNFLATLCFSQGVPMLLAGDEIGRTQAGNNNAYCQDSELSWLDWALGAPQQRLLEFVRRVIALRAAHPVLRRRVAQDFVWLNPDGSEISDAQRTQAFARCLGALAPGGDDDLLLLLNARQDAIGFALPGAAGERWGALIDTGFEDGLPQARAYAPALAYPLQGRSLVLLAKPSTPAPAPAGA